MIDNSDLNELLIMATKKTTPTPKSRWQMLVARIKVMFNR